MTRRLPLPALLLSLLLTAAPALAAETDRLTVENDAGVTTFKVTSEGNVSGSSLTVQQGAGEAATVNKLVVKDSTGANKFVVQANGAIGIGTSTAPYPLTISSDIATEVPGGIGMAVLTGNSNKERMEIRSYGSIWSAPSYQGKGIQWVNGAPAATKKDQYLVSFAGSGHDGIDIVIGNKGLVAVRAEEDWSPTKQGAYIIFETTTPGSTTRTEKARLSGAGNLGIGTTTPSQKLEVAGGLRLNTAEAQPACSSTTRGTFWFTQGGSGEKDTVAVCAKDTGDEYAWRTLY